MLDGLGEVGLFAVQRGFQQQLAQSQNAVHGGANFMAHGGQKPAFGHGGRLGRRQGGLQGLRALAHLLLQAAGRCLQGLVGLVQRQAAVLQQLFGLLACAALARQAGLVARLQRGQGIGTRRRRCGWRGCGRLAHRALTPP